MDDTVRIRRITSHDLLDMYRVSLAAHERGYDLFIPSTRLDDFHDRYQDTDEHRERYATKMHRYTEEAGGYGLAIVGSTALIGYVVTASLDSRLTEIKGIFIDPSYQGKGYGKRLLGTAVKQSADTTITLLVIAVNSRAQALYQLFGFTEIESQEPSFYGAQQIRMRRTVSSHDST